jgi:uncharacterized protein
MVGLVLEYFNLANRPRFFCQDQLKSLKLFNLCACITSKIIKEKIMREDMLISALNELNGGSADIEASAVISTDGLVIASVLPKSMDEDRVGAMTAAMLSLGDRTAQELARGTLEQVIIKGDKGYVVMTYAGSEAVVSLVAKPSAKLGLIFLDLKRAAESISKML